MGEALQHALDLFRIGGPIMWPLLALSLLSVALSVERAVFWVRQHGGNRRAWLAKAADYARRGDVPSIRAMCAKDRSVYASVIERLVGDRASRALSRAGVYEFARHQVERFGATQASIITASPLLGILGTVLGIIESFDLLGSSDAIADLSAVAGGIAEALVTTAFGLIVALVTLFPYMAFRAQANAFLSVVEALTEAVILEWGMSGPADDDADQA
jgi:biopolymer transport protein ExbB